MTRDIDLVIDPNDADRPFLLKALSDEFVLSEEAVLDAFVHGSMFNVLREGSLVKIDAFLRRRELDTNEVFERRRFVSFAERELKISSLEDLILAKLSWARDNRSECSSATSARSSEPASSIASILCGAFANSGWTTFWRTRSMRDTSPEFEADYQRRMAALSPQQRLRMVGDMYEFARRTARAGILMQKPDATETEIQQAIFLRFYRDDFPPEERQRILGLIAEWHASRDRNA